MGPTDAPVMEQMVAGSPLQAKYGEAIDRESAHELLTRRYSEAEAQPEPADSPANAPRTPDASTTDPGPADTPPAPTRQETPTHIPTPRRAPRQRAETASAPQESMFEKVVESQAFKQFTRTAAREIARGIFGTGRRRRR